MNGQPMPHGQSGGAHAVLARDLRTHARTLADQAADRHLEARPQLTARYGPLASVRCREDGVFHVDHLAAALATDRAQLFADYVAWLRELLHGHGMDDDDIVAHLSILVTVVGETLGADARAAVEALVTRGLATGVPRASAQASHLDADTPLGVLASDYLDALLVRDRRRALALIHAAADDGVEIAALYLDVFAPVLREVGRLWQLGEATVGQEHLVTAATQLAMAQLYPRTLATRHRGGTIVVAAVGGELHEIGAHMVADLFELDGWDSHFLGANTPTTAVVDTVTNVQADVLAVSVTLPTHVPIAAELVTRCRERHPEMVILAGGRPFTMVTDLWQQIGADGTATDARHAVALASDLVAAP